MTGALSPISTRTRLRWLHHAASPAGPVRGAGGRAPSGRPYKTTTTREVLRASEARIDPGRRVAAREPSAGKPVDGRCSSEAMP